MENYRPISYTALHHLLTMNERSVQAHPLVEEVDRHWLTLDLPNRKGDALVRYAEHKLLQSLDERPVPQGRSIVLHKCYCGANPALYDMHQRVLFRRREDGSLMYTQLINEHMALNGARTGIYLTIELEGIGEAQVRKLD